jgi:uncharacterized membrane protein
MSEIYLWLKWAHVVSSTVLFGMGAGIAFFFRPGAKDGRCASHCSSWARGRHCRCNLHSERSCVAAGHRFSDGTTRRISAFPAVVAMVDRAVLIDWVLLAASGMATGPDAESSGARDAGRHGVAHCVLPMLSLVVLSRVAGVHWSARRLLSNGGEARDMIEKNLSASIALYRHQATFYDGRPDGKILTAATDCYAIQMLADAGDD